MDFILFGAGNVGLKALHLIGEKYVKCFADNYKEGTCIQGKKVISYQDMIAEAGSAEIIITSDDYVTEMEQQLISSGVSEYFIFNRRYESHMNDLLPKYICMFNTQYMSYTDILLNHQIYNYNNIVILGTNRLLKNLLFEIAVLHSMDKVRAIIGEEDVPDYYGIPNIRWEDMDETVDCVIVNVPRTMSDIRERISFKNFKVIDIYDVDKFIFYNRHPELVKFKNIYQGKRVFIIGNGPSVKISDLDKLHENGDICFGLNKVYKIYGQTKWRPDYLCISDERVMAKSENIYERLAEKTELILADQHNLSFANDRINYVHLKMERFYPNHPGFSSDITEGVFWGLTTVYTIALQCAAYMGATEIYLIGVDHHHIGKVTDKRNHFIENYFEEDEEELYKNAVADFEGMNLAFEKAERYSRENGFRIYNATRGGKLEVFERVDFDSLF